MRAGGHVAGRARDHGRRRARSLAERGRDAQRLALADQHGAVHHRRHLAHVPGPAVVREHPHILVGDRHGPQAEAVRRAVGEVVGEGANIGRAGRAAAG